MKIQTLKSPTSTELTQLMHIWLQGNLDAHPFVPADYWQSMVPAVAEQLPQATLYAATEGEMIIGFAGLVDDYIAGIFVAETHRDQGVGHTLLTQLQSDYQRLQLDVYTQNERAICFYQRHGFQAQPATMEPDTHQPEQRMVWSRA